MKGPLADDERRRHPSSSWPATGFSPLSTQNRRTTSPPIWSWPARSNANPHRPNLRRRPTCRRGKPV